jgi:hypothetical protein
MLILRILPCTLFGRLVEGTLSWIARAGKSGDLPKLIVRLGKPLTVTTRLDRVVYGEVPGRAMDSPIKSANDDLLE